MEEKLHPVHPGEVLLEEFLKPLGLSQNRLALDIRVPACALTKSCWAGAALGGYGPASGALFPYVATVLAGPTDGL